MQAPRNIPSHIKKPDYPEPSHAENPEPEIYSLEEQENLRKLGHLAREALDTAHKALKQGTTTEDLNHIIHDFLISHDAYPSYLHYNDYPRSCHTSVNEVICNGIPDTRPLEKGDIVKVDVGVYKYGVHVALSETYCVG